MMKRNPGSNWLRKKLLIYPELLNLFSTIRQTTQDTVAAKSTVLFITSYLLCNETDFTAFLTSSPPSYRGR